MNEINIQQANINDVNIIYNNIKKCADKMREEGLNHWTPYYPKEKIEDDIKNNEVYIVKTQELVVGNFILTFDKEARTVCIGKLTIIPECAGKGIGSKCLKFIEDYAKVKDMKTIELDVYEKSIKAIHFYEKNGYNIIGEKQTRRFIVKKMKKELIKR